MSITSILLRISVQESLQEFQQKLFHNKMMTIWNPEAVVTIENVHYYLSTKNIHDDST